MMSPSWNHWHKEMGIKSPTRVYDVFSLVACWCNFLFHLFDLPKLAKETVSICHVPVFGNQAILNTEHVNHIKVEFVARGRNPKPIATRVCGRGRAVNKYKVPFGNDLFESVPEVGHGLKGHLKKIPEAGLSLWNIRIVLDIIIPHQLIQCT